MLSVASVTESFVALENESAISVVSVSAPLKFQLLPVFQALPAPPQPNEPRAPLVFVSVGPKLRSIFGTVSLRLMSAKSFVPLAAGSILGT